MLQLSLSTKTVLIIFYTAQYGYPSNRATSIFITVKIFGRALFRALSLSMYIWVYNDSFIPLMVTLMHYGSMWGRVEPLLFCAPQQIGSLWLITIVDF